MVTHKTYLTARFLAMGHPPRLLAQYFGVTANAIHQRRLRFERATGGETTGRHAKRGPPRADETVDALIRKLVESRPKRPAE